MIAIVVDTNTLRESPRLSRPEWDSLSQNKAEWGITLLIPEVVLMETVTVVSREWATQRDLFAKAKVGDLGLKNEVDAILCSIQSNIDDYQDQLTKRLSALGAEIATTPEVPHLDVARRASLGIAPYREKTKDGYRDTLIWLTVLDLAMKMPDHEIWFVSNNDQDFGDPSFKKKDVNAQDTPQLPRHLHPQLTRELEEHGLRGRVKYATSLRALEQHIASQHGPIAIATLDALVSAVDWSTVQDLLNDETSIFVSPKEIALSPKYAYAVVNELRMMDGSGALSDAAGRGPDRWTANYSVEVEADILAFTSDSATFPTAVQKPLLVTGTASFARHGTAQELQIFGIEAMSDDPDRRSFDWLYDLGIGPKEYRWLQDPKTDTTLDELKHIAKDFTADDLQKALEALSRPDQ